MVLKALQEVNRNIGDPVFAEVVSIFAIRIAECLYLRVRGAVRQYGWYPVHVPAFVEDWCQCVMYRPDTSASGEHSLCICRCIWCRLGCRLPGFWIHWGTKLLIFFHLHGPQKDSLYPCVFFPSRPMVGELRRCYNILKAVLNNHRSLSLVLIFSQLRTRWSTVLIFLFRKWFTLCM